MSAYLVVDVTVQDPELFKSYALQSKPLVEKHGGIYRVRGGDVDVREGSWQPQRLVIVEFPSQAHARAFLADPAYQPVKAIRQASASSNMVVVAGCGATSQ